MSLSKTLDQFKTSMLAPASMTDADDFHDLFLDNEISLSDRLGVYRNNVMVGLSDPVIKTYPLVEKLTGEDFMRGMARQYICQHPPTAGCLNHYGAAFPDFIASFEPAKGLPYLPDIARFEWLWNEAYYATDDTPIAPEKLQALSDEDYEHLVFDLRSSAQLMESPYPISQIKAFCEEENPGGTLDINNGGEKLLILRPGLDVTLHPLSDDEYTILRGFLDNKPLGTLIEDVRGDFDLAAFLQKFLHMGCFADFHLLKT